MNDRTIKKRGVMLDPIRLGRQLANAGLSRFDFRNAAEDRGLILSLKVVDKACRGEVIDADSAKTIADYFNLKVTDLLSPLDPLFVPVEIATNGTEWEWEIDRYLEPCGHLAANGLRHFLCRMRHRQFRDRLGRGKFYLLSGLSAAERKNKHEHLRRHPEVAGRLVGSRHIAPNLSATWVERDTGWWIVDAWVGNNTMAKVLAKGLLASDQLPRMMRDIALALRDLHRANIVVRELTPGHLLMADEDGRVVLTDFELAKLLEGKPTVHPEHWPDDPYRAPEVDSGQVTVQSDLFSWGRILLHAASGKLPPLGSANEANLLSPLPIPKKVWAVTRACLAASWRQRPTSVDDLLTAIDKWK